jgi:3,4-dihydroxy 2-butanone 4-phosphate synthase/GTP cyclohydrolase II
MVGLDGYGLSIVEQMEIETEPNEYNRRYLECKQLKMGHLLNLDTVS